MSPAGMAESNTQLTGRRLGLARGVWVVVVALALGLYLWSIPLQYADNRNQISPASLEQLRQAGLSPDFYSGYLTTLTALFVLMFALVGIVIFWRKSDDWMGLFAALTLVLLGVTNNSPLASIGIYYPALNFLPQLATFLGEVTFNLFFFFFPDGRFVPRWMRWLAPLVVVHAALFAFRPDLLGVNWFGTVETVAAVFAQIYRYWRVSNAVQRQQTKWVVFGTTIASAGILGVIVVGSIVWPGDQSPGGVTALIAGTIWNFFLVLIPLSIGIAILRSHLWDIDLLIRRALIYGLLTALLALVYLGAVVALQAIFTAVTGEGRSELVTVISTLVIAALFVPLRRRLQAAIDRRFYRRKYDAARTLAQFGASLRDDAEADLGQLSAHLLEAVDESMQPAAVSLWLRGRIE